MLQGAPAVRLSLLVALALVALIPSSLLAGPPRAAQAPPPTEPAALDSHLVLFVSMGPAVEVLVDEQTRIEVPALGQMAARTTADRLTYTVRHGDDWQYGGALDLRGQTERLVTISEPSSHLNIVNRGAEAAEILFEEQKLGVLAKDGTRLWGPLPSGRRRLVAVGVRSRTWSVLDIDLLPGQAHTAILPPAETGLVVKNTIDEPVRVSVDQHDHGALESQEAMTVLGLAPGSHLVEMRGLRSGRSWKYDSKLGEQGSSAADAGPLRLWLDNQTGETLRLPPSLGGLYDRPIEPGSRVPLLMQRKPVRLTVRGEDSGLDYKRDVQPDPAEQSWRLERPRGQLRLTNGTGEDAEVDIGGRHRIAIKKGATVQLRNVLSGKLQLLVTTQDSHQTFERGIFMEPRGDIAWTVTAGAASLVVHNAWPEPIELEIDGAPRGQVQAGAVFRAARVQPGLHEVVARASLSGQVDAALVKVLDGKVARLDLQPPMAGLRVVNDSDERYDVVVRGVEVGRVPPGEARAFNVAPGRIVAEVRGAVTGLHVSWSGKLSPAQHLPLPSPVRGGGAIEVTNDQPAAVELRVGDRDALRIEPGKHVRVEGLAAGEHLVEIRGANFHQRQRVLLQDGLPPAALALLPTVLKKAPTKAGSEPSKARH